MANHDRILIARRNAKLTQAQLAKALGIQRSHLVAIEKGRVTVDRAFADRAIDAIIELKQVA